MNILVTAHRTDQDAHEKVQAWFDHEVNSDRPFALADVVVSGFLRIVTNPRIYGGPTSLDVAVRVIDRLVTQPTCVPVAAGPRHWPILQTLLQESDARGNLVPGAHLAAIAIEHGATVATRDRGFARFTGVRWLDPLRDTS